MVKNSDHLTLIDKLIKVTIITFHLAANSLGCYNVCDIILLTIYNLLHAHCSCLSL